MIITIISIITTAIISIAIAKWQMKKNEITHFSINSYDIGKGLSDEFPDFKLHFAGEALADNVMVFKGGFMNTGRNDIDGLKGENDIKMILPERCKIKAVKIQPSTEGLTVLANTENEKENILNLGISEVFKTNEFFRYTAIVETSNELDDNHIKFQHRIINTDKIKHISIGNGKRPIKRKRFFFSGFYILFLCFLQFSLSLYPGCKFNIYEKETGKEINVRVDPFSNIHVSDGINLPYVSSSVISCKEFKDNYKIEAYTEFNWFNATTFISIIEIILLASILLWLYYIGWGKFNHITNVIAKNSKNRYNM